MGILYLAGQRPGSGVTALATGLAGNWRKAGKRVAVVKPVALAESGDASFYARTFDTADDASMLLSEADLEAAAKRAAELDAIADVVIVEGLPYVDSKGNAVAESPALAEQMGARVVGVIPYSHSLAAADAGTWRNSYASSLAGVIFNRRTPGADYDATKRLAPAFEDAGVSVHGIVPEQRRLLAPTVGQIVDLLAGTYYAGATHQQDLVEHFLIGGLITEWGGNYFDRLQNQAVLVRGGRMDIQMAALNFPMACLLLTGCEKPSQYVYQRANDLDVPLVTVAHDTHSATALLEQIEQQVSIDHPDKIELVTSMVGEAVDLAAVGTAAGVRGA